MPMAFSGANITTITNSWTSPFRLGNLFIWHDKTNDVARMKHGTAPTSETDGNIIVEG